MPVFSVVQLKALTPLFYDIAEKASTHYSLQGNSNLIAAQLSDVLSREANSQYNQSGKSVLDMNEWMSRVALESDPLNSAANNPYTEAIKELMYATIRSVPVAHWERFVQKEGGRVDAESDDTKVEDCDAQHGGKIILQERRENIRRESGKPDREAKDIISVLLRENDRAPLEEKMSDKELTGQMTVLIFGAQDTTSSCLSRTLDLLAMNPDIQAKVRRVWSN
ncbi:hypothetical protein MPER_02422, partial [Moniliophthora perniciosa FA553]